METMTYNYSSGLPSQDPFQPGTQTTPIGTPNVEAGTIKYSCNFDPFNQNLAPPAHQAPTLKTQPSSTLREIAANYFATHERIALAAPKDTKFKALETLSNDRGHMIVWLELFGDMPVDLLDERSRAQFLNHRQTEWSTRQYFKKNGTPGKVVKKMARGSTIDHCVITIVVIFQWAYNMGLINKIPFWYVPRKDRLAKGRKRRKKLLVEHVNALIDEANAPVPPGIPALMGDSTPRRRKQLQNYLSFCAWAGSRREETCMLKWEYITFARRDQKGDYIMENDKPLCGTVFFPSEIQKHSHGHVPKDREIEFNPQLEKLLLAMYRDRKERNSNEEYLFPALPGDARVRYNKKGQIVEPKPYQVRFDTGLRRVLEQTFVRSADGTERVRLRDYYKENVTLHDLRVFFITEAVMAGVDLITIAAWVGHVDKKMIEEIYAQVSGGHRATQALRLRFLPHTIGRERSVPQEFETPPAASHQTTP
jgi:integrase